MANFGRMLAEAILWGVIILVIGEISFRGFAKYKKIELTACYENYVLEWSLFITGFLTSVIFQIWNHYKTK